VKNKIAVNLECSKGKAVVQKLNYVLEKNPGYKALWKISKILSGEVEDMEGSGLFYVYAPMSSEDIERIFSMYKNYLYQLVIVVDSHLKTSGNILLCSVIFKVLLENKNIRKVIF